MWQNKKQHETLIFKGRYEREASGERVFVLTALTTKRRITFESFQLAKTAGWVKLL